MQGLVDDHRSEAAFHKLCDLYIAATPAQRDQFRAVVDLSGHTWSIPMDSTLVDGTVREFPPERRIRASLIYHSIENARPVVSRLVWKREMAHSSGGEG